VFVREVENGFVSRIPGIFQGWYADLNLSVERVNIVVQSCIDGINQRQFSKLITSGELAKVRQTSPQKPRELSVISFVENYTIDTAFLYTIGSSS